MFNEVLSAKWQAYNIRNFIRMCSQDKSIQTVKSRSEKTRVKKVHTSVTRSIVRHGDFTSQFSNLGPLPLPGPPTKNLSGGSITPAISRTDVKVFSSINPDTCSSNHLKFKTFTPSQTQRVKKNMMLVKSHSLITGYMNEVLKPWRV